MSLSPPFSAHLKGPHTQVLNEFPASAKSGLLHLLYDLVDRNYVVNWGAVARELQRIGRRSPVTYSPHSVKDQLEARDDAYEELYGLSWEKTYDFCERLYSFLPQELGYTGSYGDYVVTTSRGEIQAYVQSEIQRLFQEEGIAYEFIDGSVRRLGRKHSVEVATKAEVVLGDPRLHNARKHYDKALQFFRNPTSPDFENAVKEAVCAVEAAGKVLFPNSKSATLGSLVSWFNRTDDVSVPPGIAKTIEGIYAFRSGGEGVGHGGATGGTATAAVAEYVLATCASQIIYFVDLANSIEAEVPF